MSSVITGNLANKIDDCVICRDEMDKDEAVQGHKASKTVEHLFHTRCFMNWMGESRTCPTCRHPIAYQRVDVQKAQKAEQAKAVKESIRAMRKGVHQMTVTTDRCIRRKTLQQFVTMAMVVILGAAILTVLDLSPM